MTSLYLGGDTRDPSPCDSSSPAGPGPEGPNYCSVRGRARKEHGEIGTRYRGAPRSPLGAARGIHEGTEYLQGEVYDAMGDLIDVQFSFKIVLL